MTETPARARRFAAFAALVVALLIPFVAAVVAAAPAHALPCETCGGGDQPVPWTSYITVTPPAMGTVRGMSGSDEVINCGDAGDDCYQNVTRMAVDRPTTGWPTYTFSYSGGPNGYAASWSGRCTGSGECSVANDAENSSLAVTLYDVQAPAVSIVAPARVGPNTAITASASDNAGISHIDWELCPVEDIFTPCAALDSQGTSVTLGNRTAGNYSVTATATDTSNNRSTASKNITYVAALHMTASDLAAYTEQPSFTFSSDDETHILTRRCRAYPTGGSVSDWGSCTSNTSYAPTLADGNWTLQADEIDDVGLEASVSRQTTVDTTAPSVSFGDGPAEGSTVSTPTVQLNFSVTDVTLQSVTCKLDDATPTACTSPQTLSGYADGEHTYTVTATDRFGHSTTIVRNFAVTVPTALTATPASSGYGTAATLSATVSPSTVTGAVTFVAAGKTLCQATVASGVATCTAPATLTAGTRTVTATYQGNYAPSTTNLKLVISKATTTVHATAAKSVPRGKTLAVAASNLPSNATGTVVVSNGAKQLCTATVRNGAARCAFAAAMSKGSRTLTVRYRGDTNYAASTKTIKLSVV